MVRARISISLILALVLTTSGWAGGRKTSPDGDGEFVCKVYALSEVSDSRDVAVWLAKTIPEVIEPGSWGMSREEKGVLTFHIGTGVLVVYHTPQVQSRVEGFLKDVCRALPEPAKAKAAPAVASAPVQPARHVETAPGKFLEALKEGKDSGRGPRHLFHIIVDGLEGGEQGFKMNNFTLKYEGEGIIDSNIADIIKTLNRGEMERVVQGLAEAGATRPAVASPSARAFVGPLVGPMVGSSPAAPAPLGPPPPNFGPPPGESPSQPPSPAKPMPPANY